jgi:hypothetical protein
VSPLVDLTKRPRRHSYSAISVYKECPARYAYRYIAKLPEPSSAAMDRGTRLHKLCEDYVTDTRPEVAPPYDVRRIALKLYQLRTKRALPEREWHVTRDWEACEKDDPNSWIKAIVDVHYVEKEIILLHDYKSGREYPSHADQLELYAAMGLCQYPDARRAVSSPLYIDSGVEGRQRSIIRDMLPAITRKWGGLIGRMEGDAALLPTPGGHCKRCAFGVSKGGPCLNEQRGGPA